MKGRDCLDVKTNGATHVLRGYEKISYSDNEIFLGRARQAPKPVFTA